MIIYCNDFIVANRVRVADNSVKRFLGLMGKKKLDCGEGLLLIYCSSIHCFFMRTTIDVVYLSKEFIVTGIETLKPWSIGRHYRKTRHVLELAEGVATNVKVGDQIIIQQAEERKGD